MNATSPKIDTHQHFRAINDTGYVWMTGAHATIKRDFLPADLRPLLDKAGIDGCVAVLARQMVCETEWLLALADEHPWIRGVVGRVRVAEDLTSALSDDERGAFWGGNAVRIYQPREP